ncbi:ABC-F family ATP-binding cassette domain-containing protein [Streptomyces sp. P01-B04]|uniref:ribosomal protection-like ABC-F family protein n=1 Tax=Streptomyces poriferorum TaxID=2798799 RepID=UPI001C603B1C|nr:ABC-F family ATP-binding cassette domain-containing protein [Streptomyces poriferorum]MBW5251049.1 ABC-F family ATP-binding cassette domain-containing protein [Streptomyces poriferorum]MBW5256020.1 ABC-F family ATP-binding cassette domain-containing protein [Streptomyces poriferorum]
MPLPHDRAQLTLKDVSKSYGDRAVLDQVSLTVRPGDHVGVIGENGSGKSTLLRLIAGAETPGSGEITVRFHGGTGYLSQTLDLDPTRTVQDAVDAALAELRALERRIRAAETALAAPGGADDAQLATYGDLLTEYEERDGYRADARTEAALHGLGLGHLTRERTLGSLSGGEQSRLALACVLASGPELLLLDEPTNHLDLRAVTWLEDQLRAHRGTLVVITHDRAFLERTTTVIVEVDRDLRSVVRYGDGWDGYRTARAAARRRWARDHQEWVDELARTEELVNAAGQRLAAAGKDPGEGWGKHRRSHEAKLSGQVRAARARLEGLRREPVPAPPQPLRFSAGLTPASGGDGHPGPLVELASVAVGDRLHVPALRVDSGQRLLVTGPNGAGKSTLLRVLAGDLAPGTGTVRRRARIGYLPQELPARPTRRTLLATFAAGRPGQADEYTDMLLDLGLFRAEDLTVPVAALSVGQQRRLALARLVTRPADLLVLDEPTNHITLALVEELEAALAAYAGAVVVVSHDRSFRSRFTGERLELHAGRPVARP